MKDYVDAAVRHVLLRQGVLGIKARLASTAGALFTCSGCRPLGSHFHNAIVTSG